MKNHPQIWLEPWCHECAAMMSFQTWSWEDVYDPCHCGAQPARYVLALSAEREIARLREALEDIASGRYSGVLLTSFPPKDPAVERARAALAEQEKK